MVTTAIYCGDIRNLRNPVVPETGLYDELVNDSRDQSNA